MNIDTKINSIINDNICNDWSENSITSMCFNFLSNKANKKLISKLLKLGINLQEEQLKSDNFFSSKVIVITGSFNNIARSQLKEELIRSGARVSSSVSSRTDYLIAGEKPGSKLNKAVELGIEVLEEDKALKLLNSDD